MKAPLQLIEDVAGERLVLVAPASGALAVLRELSGDVAQGLAQLVREERARPRTPGELLKSVGMMLLVVLLSALVLLACFMSLVGVALVVVAYAIGVWLIAWLIVPVAARYLLEARSPSRPAARLTMLSFAREPGQLSWRARGAAVRSFASLSSLRVSIRSQTGTESEMALELTTPGESSATRLHFSVDRIDREEEAFDLCMRMARVLGWHAFATARDHLRGLEIELRPAPPADRAHPFRSYAGAPRFHTIDAASTTATDWNAPVEAGFREPIEPAPPFVADDIASAGARAAIWAPGRVVELHTARALGPARFVWAQVGATLIACALPVSVVVMINAVGGLPLLETVQRGGKSFAGVLGMLTAWSAGFGWVLALVLLVRRTGQKAAAFDWGRRELTIRDDQGRHVVAFAEIVELVLTETADRRYCMSATFKARPKQLLLESEPASSAHQGFLSLTVELARALGVAWRCVSDVP